MTHDSARLALFGSFTRPPSPPGVPGRIPIIPIGTAIDTLRHLVSRAAPVMLETPDRRRRAMTGDFGRLYADLGRRAGEYGVRVPSRRLPPETPAVFDGPTVA